jgi:ribonucleoside-triphosphate reductase
MGKKITFNTELVPAENLGVKFAKWDAKDGYKTYRDCYNSYLYRVEDPCVDIIDKFQIHGEETLKHLDGGSAVHINLEELPNKGTWLKIMDRATFYGTNYWTYNVRSTVCNHCGYIDKRDLTSCSKCGTIDVDHATRIIGYLKRITSFSDARQKEAGLRLYHKQ